MLSVGLGIASLRAGGMLAAATVCISVTIILAIAIIAFVGRGQLKCFATGFMIPLTAYAFLHIAAGDAELDPFQGELPTTRLLRPIYRVVVTRTWLDAVSGKELPDYQPGTMPARHEGGFLPPGVTRVVRSETPDRTAFMTLGHVLLAMGIGYVGGKFAVVVQRYQDSTPPS